MAITRRQGVIFGAGLALGAVASVVMVMALRSTHVADKARVSAPEKAQPAVADKPKASARAAAQPEAVASRQHADCPVQPVLTASGNGDGHFRLQEASTKTAADIPAFITLGKESAAAGKRRDAEIAFVMSCRVADKVGGADSVAAADARYQLGRHYANVALGGDAPTGSVRAELLRRAEALYDDSLQTFVAKHGREHEKSRFASEGLNSVRQTLAQAGQRPQAAPAPQKPSQAAVATAAPEPRPPAIAARPVAPEPPVVAKAPAPAPAARPAEPEPPPAVAGRPMQPPTSVAAATPPAARRQPAPRPQPREAVEPREAEVEVAEPAVRQATGSATQARPSFDCAKARSPSEKAICSDAELSQLDRDLGRLHARAKAAAANSAAFRRRNDEEWRRRESTCRGDRECLRQWYADRREQLMAEVQ